MVHGVGAWSRIHYWPRGSAPPQKPLPSILTYTYIAAQLLTSWNLLFFVLFLSCLRVFYFLWFYFCRRFILAGPSDPLYYFLFTAEDSTSILSFYHFSVCHFVDQSDFMEDTQRGLYHLFSSPSNIQATMYAARAAARPKLALNTTAAQNARPTLSLKSPMAVPRTPISPVPVASPAKMRFSTLQVPTYAYTNSCSSKSILKKQKSGRSGAAEKRIQFQFTPTVHCVTPIENPDEYYGKHTKMTREERRWQVRE